MPSYKSIMTYEIKSIAPKPSASDTLANRNAAARAAPSESGSSAMRPSRTSGTRSGNHCRNTGRGRHFSNVDQALDAAVEGAGLLRTHAILAHDGLKDGTLAMPFKAVAPSDRACNPAYPKANETQAAGSGRAGTGAGSSR